MIKHPVSHVDHGLTEVQLKYILDQFADRQAFFIETIELPDDLGTVPCGLYGRSWAMNPSARTRSSTKRAAHVPGPRGSSSVQRVRPARSPLSRDRTTGTTASSTPLSVGLWHSRSPGIRAEKIPPSASHSGANTHWRSNIRLQRIPMASKYISASIKPPRRVQITRSDGSTGYWKPGQFGYAISYSTHPGMHTLDKGPTEAGELAYLVSKASHGRGGALWFSAEALRFTGKDGAPRPAHAAKKHHLTASSSKKLFRFTKAELQKMPTISSGHFENLKAESTVDGIPTRWWLTRMTVEDGENHAVHVEQLLDGSWQNVHKYAPADKSSHARKKKLTSREAKQLLVSDDIDLNKRDYFDLSSSEVQRVLEVAKLVGYRKSKNAPGSTGRMFVQHLRRVK